MYNELSHINARDVKPFKIEPSDAGDYLALADMGICFDAKDIQKMAACAMDAALTVPLTTASITTPVQFLQAWLPGFVEVITAARVIDLLTGITTQGRWEDEEIVQGIMELTGKASHYGDLTNVPLSSYNANYERRTIVRFEEGMQVGILEEKRAAAAQINNPENKRKAAASALEIVRNLVGFYGYNSGANRTYGLLNDPGLPAYSTVATGTGGTTFAVKTFLEMTADIREALSALRIQSEQRIDPMRTPIVFAIAMSAIDYMTVTSDGDHGSVFEWLKETYPNIRVESVPEFDSANGGANVFYMYAESVEDTSTDDSRTFVQVVPAKFQTLGVEQRVKTYLEDYSNATAGVLCKRPYAVIRRSGI